MKSFNNYLLENETSIRFTVSAKTVEDDKINKSNLTSDAVCKLINADTYSNFDVTADGNWELSSRVVKKENWEWSMACSKVGKYSDYDPEKEFKTSVKNVLLKHYVQKV